ncbi:hypothetical protein RCL_jg8964.t1 [Rhizophagus clarus]|uniref:Uncharacterized protein n=1 Tax=Rhizophagus clarus TaxID=94130 RepID=A0A8H3KYK4_9GLOM|nr:hypothetical protein RCL_jg8964.t1 [Rhizophagus clarus]
MFVHLQTNIQHFKDLGRRITRFTKVKVVNFSIATSLWNFGHCSDVTWEEAEDKGDEIYFEASLPDLNSYNLEEDGTNNIVGIYNGILMSMKYWIIDSETKKEVKGIGIDKFISCVPTC